MNITNKIKVCVFLLSLLMGVSSSFANEPKCSDAMLGANRDELAELEALAKARAAVKVKNSDISKLSAREVNRKLHELVGPGRAPLEVIQEYLKHPGANVHSVVREGFSGFDLVSQAIYYVRPIEIFQAIMNHSSLNYFKINTDLHTRDDDPYPNDKRPLAVAVERGWGSDTLVPHIEELLKHEQVDVNITIRGYTSLTPAFYKAVKDGTPRMVRAFLKRKDLNIKASYMGAYSDISPLKAAKEELSREKRNLKKEKNSGNKKAYEEAQKNVRNYEEIIREIKKHQRGWKKWILASSLLALIVNECSGDPIGVDSLVSKIGEMNTLAGDYKEEMSDFLRENGKEEVCDFLEESKEEVSDFLEESKEEVSDFLEESKEEVSSYL